MSNTPTPLRAYSLTPFLTLLATACVRLSPLFILMAHFRNSTLTVTSWAITLCAVIVLQVVFFFVERRCASPELSFHRGLAIVSACMSTGWIYLDPIFVFFGVALTHVLSCFAALLPDSAMRYRKIIHGFYRHRMEQ